MLGYALAERSQAPRLIPERQRVRYANASANGDLLPGVVAVSTVSAWTAGNTQDGQTLTERYGCFIPTGDAARVRQDSSLNNEALY